MNRAIRKYELEPIGNWQKSFYRKAYVTEYEDGRKELISYRTKVAECKNGTMIINGYYSATTWKHIREFMYQNNIHVDLNTKAGKFLAKNAKLCNGSNGVLVIKDGKVNAFFPKGEKKKKDGRYYSDMEDYELKGFYRRYRINA